MSNLSPSSAFALSRSSLDLELADLVGKRLSRDGDEALVSAVALLRPRELLSRMYWMRLVAGPTLGVDAGIDDQADRTEAAASLR